MTASILRAAAVAAALAAAVSAADAPRDVFGVGVLRRDGIIIPFAAYDGKKWSANWPKPALELTIPINLSSVPSKWWGPTPPLATWQVNTAAGVGTVQVRQPDWVDIHCARQIGLRTDYQPALLPPPLAAQPYPKDGLAISPAHAVVPISVVPPSGNEARDLFSTVQSAFNTAERKTEDRHGHPVPQHTREGNPPTIEAIYGYGRTPRVYYVEATRTYRSVGSEPGECSVGFGTGWFYQDVNGVREVLTRVDLLDCRRDTASYMVPLGVLQLGNHVYWLAQFAGADHERYVVLELKQKTVDVVENVWGGAC